MKNLFLLLFIGLFYTNIVQAQFNSWFEPSSITRGGITYIQKVGFYAFGGSKTVAVAEGSPPSVPTLLFPTNNSFSTLASDTLDWSNVATATSYDLLVSNSSDFSLPIVEFNSTISSYDVSLYLGSWSECGIYYWKVRANNSYGSSAYSSAFIFDTRSASPTLTQPLNGATGLNPYDEILFEWGHPVGVVDYTIQIASDIEFTSLIVDSREGIEEYLLTPGSLEPLTTYYWRVGSNNANSCVIFSPIFSFTTSF